MSRLALAARLVVMGAAFAVLAPLQSVANRLGWRMVAAIPVRFHRLFLRLFAIRVRVEGSPPPTGTATLVLANHVSWLDIPVMGSLMPLSFIAKQEIAAWPVFGFLARLQRCVFLDRTRKGATAEVNALVGERLSRGDVIVLFPEGTTGDGLRLLPFRSSLVGAARAALTQPALGTIRVQPFAVVYVGRDGLPMTRRTMPEVAWYGDMELPPHAATFFRGGSLDVVVVWGEPIPFDVATDRKHATAAAESAVRDAIRAARRGRTGPAAGGARRAPDIPPEPASDPGAILLPHRTS